MRLILLFKIFYALPVCEYIRAKLWFERFDLAWPEILEMNIECIDKTDFENTEYIDCST